jgi:hypothetical protein
MTTNTLTQSDLEQFTGSETYYRHWLTRRIVFTDGAKYLADKAGAHWLLDEIAFRNVDTPAVFNEPFQAWKLVVNGRKGKLSCDDGNGNIVFKKTIGFTDFPMAEVSIWFADNTIFLPSEY